MRRLPQARPVTRLVLASASPRREYLLTLLGIEFEVRPVDINEDPGNSIEPEIIARKLARMKAEAARLRDEVSPIFAADTIVWFEEESLGKPRDAEDARQTLRRLRGHEHQVISAVAFMPEKKRSIIARHPITRVRMRNYGDEEIEGWIDAGIPFDKAGSYGIQGVAPSPVEAYRGCYCNVIGMSLIATLDVLRKGGIKLTKAAQLLPECAACPLAPPPVIPSPAAG